MTWEQDKHTCLVSWCRLPQIAVPFEQCIFREFSRKLCSARENSNCMTDIWKQSNMLVCVLPWKTVPGKNSLDIQTELQSAVQTALREVPGFKCYQTYSACSLVPSLLHPSPVSSLTAWKEWSLGPFLFLTGKAGQGNITWGVHHTFFVYVKNLPNVEKKCSAVLIVPLDYRRQSRETYSPVWEGA